MTDIRFAGRGDKNELENGTVFQPKFDADGLIACVVTDADDGTVLMVGYMNAEALARTIETGEAWYWSRSRQEYWKKGGTSGQVQQVVELLTDCDQDALVMKVRVAGNGATCHVGYRSCFYRRIVSGRDGSVGLEQAGGERVYDPKDVYGG
ncbi:phosphoribosyl-AMP cyclohydrolase [Stappia indica]|uniref:Phosphoribosyl-AMP cyclohydrolase n=1 Tax=Stappia indica TaxID=538381 RepID=A0A857C506_9HYPH|nr:phosphoribosyl-AMP cyclohydrolase [Stappia indica]QGZ33981.1 phosphoribosyl-AMP cyclohydrolase [Stappia indica]